MRARSRGMLLVEAVIGVAIFAVVAVAMVVGFVKITSNLNQSRVKKQVTEYAQAELQNYIAQSRVPAMRDGNVVRIASVPQLRDPDSSNPNPLGGYLRIGSSPLDDGQPHALPYPASVMGSESAENKDRYTLNRTVTITKMAAGLPNEYVNVAVTLSDTHAIPRFSPVTLETQIRRPNGRALDTRTSHDNASLTVKARDYVTGIPISVLNNPLAQISTSSQQGLSFTGETTFGGLKAGDYYVATVTAKGYWLELSNTVHLSAGSNSVGPIILYPVITATTTIKVVNAVAPHDPIPGAKLNVTLPQGEVPVPNLSVYSGMSNVSTTYDFYTELDGVSAQALTIPRKHDRQYAGFYRLATVSKAGFWDAHPANYTLSLDADVPSHALADVSLYPKRMGNLDIIVMKDGTNRVNSSPETGGLVTVTYATNDCAAGSLNASKTLDENGHALIPVLVNCMDAPSTTSRLVNVKVQRAMYRIGYEFNFTVAENQTKYLVMTLTPHKLSAHMWNGFTSPTSRLEITQGRSIYLYTVPAYWGHMSDDTYVDQVLAYTPWTTTNPGLGSYNAYSWYYSLFTALTTNGEADFNAHGTYHFSYSGGDYGPACSADLPLETATDYSTIYLKVIPPSGTAVLTVDIAGPATVNANSTNDYTATARWGSNETTVPTLSWTMSATPPPIGTLANATSKTTTLTAFGVSFANQYMYLTVTADGTTGGMGTASRTMTVTMNPPSPLTATLPVTSVSLLSNQSFTTQVTASGGTPPYTFDWTLLDLSNNVLGPSSPNIGYLSNYHTDSVTFQAAVGGDLKVNVTVRDAGPGFVTKQFTIHVEPPGTH